MILTNVRARVNLWLSLVHVRTWLSGLQLVSEDDVKPGRLTHRQALQGKQCSRKQRHAAQRQRHLGVKHLLNPAADETGHRSAALFGLVS